MGWRRSRRRWRRRAADSARLTPLLQADGHAAEMQRTNSHSSAGIGSTGFSSQFSGNSKCHAAPCGQGPAWLRGADHARERHEPF